MTPDEQDQQIARQRRNEDSAMREEYEYALRDAYERGLPVQPITLDYALRRDGLQRARADSDAARARVRAGESQP